MKKLETFIKDTKGNAWVNNAWVNYKHLRVYVRRAHHVINGKLAATFDIANVDAPEQLRGRGDFWKMIELIAASESPCIIYCENVLNKRLAASLVKRGWTELKGNSQSWPPSFFLEI